MNKYEQAQRDMAIYLASRKFSKARGLTQVELAAKYGLTQGAVSKAVENGEKAYRLYREWETTVAMSTNGFPGHRDNTGEGEK